MANRFWRGGSGTWDVASTANWSATSGGAGGASAPTAVDDVFFDAASGSPVVTINSGAVCRSWSHTVGVATFAMNRLSPVAVHGAITWWTSTTVTGSVGINFLATSGSHTINLAGKSMDPSNSFGGGILIFGPQAASTATWTLSGAFVFGGSSFSTSELRLLSGTLNTGGVAITSLARLRIPGTFAASTLTLGASTLGTSSARLFEVDVQTQTLTPTTLNLGTSTIFAALVTLRGAPAGNPQTLTTTFSAGQSFNAGQFGFPTFGLYGGSQTAIGNVTGYISVTLESISGTLSTGAISQVVTGSLPNLTTQGPGSVSVASITQADSNGVAPCTVILNTGFSCGAITQSAATQAFSRSLVEESFSGGVLNITGTITTQRLLLSGSGTATLAGITQIAPVTFDSGVYLTRTAATSTGAITASDLQLSTTAAVTIGAVTSIASITEQSSVFVTNGSGTLSIASLNVGVGGTRWGVSFASSGSPYTFQCGTAALQSLGGSATGVTVTFTGTTTIANDAVSGQQGTEINLSSAQNVNFGSLVMTSAGNNGFPILNRFFSCGTVTFTGAATGPVRFGFLCNDTGFSYPAAALTVEALSIVGGARTLSLASGATVTIASDTSRSPLLEVSELTTVSAAGSTITLTGTLGVGLVGDIPPETSFIHGGKTYGTVNAVGRNIRLIGQTQRTLSVAAFTRTGEPNTTSQLRLDNTDLSCAGTLTLQGNSATNRLFVFSGLDGTPTVITAATRVLTNVDFRYITAAGGTLPWALGTSVGDCQGNTDIAFTPPVTRYAVASGAWNSTSVWSVISGGSGGASVPLPQDDVQFNSSSGGITVTTEEVRALCRNLFILNFTGTLSLNRSTLYTGGARLVEVYGDVTIGAGANVVANPSPFLSHRSILISRAVGTTTFSIASSGASFPLMSGNTTRLTMAVSPGVSLTRFVPFSGETVVGGTLNIGFITDDALLGAQDVLELSARASVPTLNLTSSSITTSFFRTTASVTGGTSSVLLDNPTQSPYSWAGSVNDLTVRNTATNFLSLTFNAATVNGVGGTFSTAPSTLPTNIFGRLTFTGTGRMGDVGSPSAAVVFGSVDGATMSIVNNTSLHLETQFAYYARTTASGTATTRIVAFGATNLGQNTGISFVNNVRVAAFTNYNGAWTLPNDFGGTYFMVAYGGGGQSTRSITSAGAGGGGGAYALTYGLAPLVKGGSVWVRAAAATPAKTAFDFNPGSTPVSSYLNVVSNAAPTVVAQGVLAASGAGAAVNGSAGAAGLATNSVGNVRTNGAPGGIGTGSSFSGGGGGGGAATGTSVSYQGGPGGTAGTRAVPLGGAGGGGQTSIGGTSTTGTGATGGGPSGGTGGSASLTSPTSGQFSATGGSGGGGGGALSTQSVTNAAFTRNSTNGTRITLSNHGYSTGTTIQLTAVTIPAGTYTRSGTSVSCTRVGHGLTSGTSIFIEITSGAVLSGVYTVTVFNTSVFSFTTAASGTTSGNFRFGTPPALGDYNITVVNTNTFSIEAGSTYDNGTMSFTRFPFPLTATAGAGGNTGASAVWAANYVNGNFQSGAPVGIGPSGGGGGGGSGGLAQGGNGGSAGVAGGGGGGGSSSSSTGWSGAGGGGGSGLVVFVYASAIENIESQVIF